MTTKRKSADHCVFEPGNVLACLNCGERYTVSMPAPIGVFAAITKAWADEHRGCRPTEAGKKREADRLAACFKSPAAWIEGIDRGVSSETIWHAIVSGVRRQGASTPRDPSDFGRCYRLVEAFKWRPRLADVVKLNPEWAGLVEHWDELSATYERELPTGKAPELYARIKELRGE